MPKLQNRIPYRAGVRAPKLSLGAGLRFVFAMNTLSSEVRICQNCKAQFNVDAADFAFYEKIQVPPPTFCPECRMQRRMAWRNERSLHRKKDDFGKEIISIYAPESPVRIYEREYWWSDKWNPMDYGKEYDFSKPFFEQFRELFESVPATAVFDKSPINSSFCNHSGYMKDCYMTFASWECERALYSERSIGLKDSLDSHTADQCEFCYEVVDSSRSYKLFFSRQCVSCSESSFLFDCRNCSNCFGCVGLRNKQYHIFNKPYSKEEYEKEIKSFDLGSFENAERFRQEFLKHKLRYPVKFARLAGAVNVSGDNVSNAKDCFSCFDMRDNVENCKYLTHGFGIKDSYDGFGIGLCELLYEGIDTGEGGASKERFSVVVYSSSDTHYCFNCEGSSDLFGCIGLRNKQYCVLNKQYTKEAYEKLLPTIKAHMNNVPYLDKKGRVYKYGEFLPAELSPFAYNETIAQEYFPLDKESATAKGYRWREPDKRSYRITIQADNLPDHTKNINDTILEETIGCAHQGTCQEQCASAFRIIPQELKFYQEMNLPLPRLCPNCRHYQRIIKRNPPKLWHRKCTCEGAMSENALYKNSVSHFHETSPCPNEFETSYPPSPEATEGRGAQERKEIVYCEKCYQAEVV